MVIVICFGADLCKSIFDKQAFYSYNECVDSTKIVAQYMKDAYPSSSGEIHCFTEQEFKDYQEYLDNGGKPTIQEYKNPSSS
jgi:hypothetical protein